ncbi:hypothetical protein MPS_4879 [Mycobacterium pseudoshottsii JCM 15466]|nr:hypothetical protein MMSP_3027 [Mycobacterium sp. 012931]GAQ39856.1 hypothetical protein MPS_4879 [Mycobacterium pseudoshottsii JCM 15466]
MFEYYRRTPTELPHRHSCRSGGRIKDGVVYPTRNRRARAGRDGYVCS